MKTPGLQMGSSCTALRLLNTSLARGWSNYPVQCGDLLCDGCLLTRAANQPSRRLKFHNHREGPSCLKVPTNTFMFKTLLRHYAKWV